MTEAGNGCDCTFEPYLVCLCSYIVTRLMGPPGLLCHYNNLMDTVAKNLLKRDERVQLEVDIKHYKFVLCYMYMYR